MYLDGAKGERENEIEEKMRIIYRIKRDTNRRNDKNAHVAVGAAAACLVFSLLYTNVYNVVVP